MFIVEWFEVLENKTSKREFDSFKKASSYCVWLNDDSFSNQVKNVFMYQEELPKEGAIVKVFLDDVEKVWDVMSFGFHIFQCKDDFQYMMLEDILLDYKKNGVQIYIVFCIDTIRIHLKLNKVGFCKRKLKIKYTFEEENELFLDFLDSEEMLEKK